MPEFFNRPNERITTTDGRNFFISRSVAVIPQIYCYAQNQLLILANRRGPDCPDHIGKWALPCGYLDWDESAEEAVRREVYEECDFDIQNIEDSQLLWGLTHWNLITHPQHDARQNVLLHYTLGFNVGEAPPPAITKISDGEVTEAAWLPIQEALQIDFAFGHQYNIYDCLKWRENFSNNLALHQTIIRARQSAPVKVKTDAPRDGICPGCRKVICYLLPKDRIWRHSQPTSIYCDDGPILEETSGKRYRVDYPLCTGSGQEAVDAHTPTQYHPTWQDENPMNYRMILTPEAAKIQRQLLFPAG